MAASSAKGLRNDEPALLPRDIAVTRVASGIDRLVYTVHNTLAQEMYTVHIVR